MSSDDPSLRIALCEAAAERWLVERRFSLADLAESQGMSLPQLLRLYDGRDALLAGWYDTRWIAFDTLRRQVPDYDRYTFEEKLGNLLYSLIELMSPRKTFVCRTWMRYMGGVPDAASLRFPMQAEDLMKGLRAGAHGFRDSFHREIRSLLDSPEVSRASGAAMRLDPALDLMWLAFLGILEYWCRDGSHDGERTAALIDKWVALVASIAVSDIAEKGIDLARFLAGDLARHARAMTDGCAGRAGCRCGQCRDCRCGRCGTDGAASESASGAEVQP